MMKGLWQDLRYAWRMLAKNPGFTLVVVLVMGLGIGVNTMIYGVVRGVLLPHLPLPEPDGLVSVYMTTARGADGPRDVSFPDFVDLRERAESFIGMGAVIESQAYLTLGTAPEHFESAVVSPTLFPALGVQPTLGRNFMPEEEQDGKQWSSVILSHRIWSQRLGADPHVLGRTFKINGRIRTVVGVMPPDFRFPEKADFWTPLAYRPHEETRDARYLEVVGRLKPGVSLKAAQAELATYAGALAKDYPATNQNFGVSATPYREMLVRNIRAQMIMLMSAVVFVLLVACANVANLTLARVITRQREVGLRLTLGAGRWRVARQLLVESVLVSLLGAALGVLIAYWATDLVMSTIPIELPYWMKIRIDTPVLLFTVGLAVATGLVFGLAPVLHASRTSLGESLKEGGLQGSSSRAHHRMRSGLVIAEVALSLVLLVGSGLVIRSFLRMQDQRTEIVAEGVLAGRITLPAAVYPTDKDRRDFFANFVARVKELPGVTGVAGTQVRPLGPESWSRTLVIEGREPQSQGESPYAHFGVVTPGCFGVLHIPIREGRDFVDADRADAPLVAIVNESAARRLWPDGGVLGAHLKFLGDSTWRTVVGIVADVRQNVGDRQNIDQVYLPHSQVALQTLWLVTRTEGDPAALAKPIRDLLSARDRDLPFYDVSSLPRAMSRALWETRLYAALMGAFATIALVIAAVGIYGVMAYSVAQRTREIGIRMALGAPEATVLRMVLGQGLMLTTIGVGFGLAGAYALTRLMANLLFGVSASDPPTFLGVVLVLAGTALVACWLPARRAARVDPIQALRME